MWTRQYQDMWADYLTTKKRERSIQYARQCIKQPHSFTITSISALYCLIDQWPIIIYHTRYNNIHANVAVYFTDKFENCQNSGDSRVDHFNNRCDRI